VILEVAILNVRPGSEAAFETAFAEAAPIIASMPGHVSHQLQRCVETPNRYLLLVEWRALEDHTIGFRGSAEYQRWKRLLHHFYDPFPTVEHYVRIAPERHAS
jgi:heme-degrading monooxygenase HmoA